MVGLAGARLRPVSRTKTQPLVIPNESLQAFVIPNESSCHSERSEESAVPSPTDAAGGKQIPPRYRSSE